MSFLAWNESPHWNRRQTTTAVKPRPIPIYKTTAQIEAEIRNKPENNAINENQMWHLIDIAIAGAEKNGTLKQEAGDVING